MSAKQKKQLVFIAVAIASFLLISMVFSRFLSSFTEDLLRDRLSKNPNKLYKISFDKLDFSILKGEIELSNISMEIDSQYVDSLKLSNHYPKTLYSGSVTAITLNGISGLDIYFNKVIRVNTLLINEPEVNLLLTHSHDSIESLSEHTTGGIKELLLSLDHSKINSIEIENGKLTVDSELENEIRRVGNADNFRLEVLNFELDSSKHDHPFVVEEVQVGFKNAEFDISPQYFMKLGSFNFSYKDSMLNAENFKLLPKQSIKQFAQSSHYKKNRMDVSIPALSCSAVDFDQLLFKEKIAIGKIDINDAVFHISKDHTKPWHPSKRFSTPFEMVHSIPISTKINELNVSNTTLTTEQLMGNGEPNSTLDITELNLMLLNVTNDSIALSSNSSMELKADLKLLSNAQLSATGKFNLINKNQNFELNATMDSTPLNLFNPLLKSAIHLEVATGVLNNASIALQGNKYQIIGTTDLDYTNATIAFEQENVGFMSKLKKNLISGIANTVLKTNNTKGDPHYKTGQVNYTYNPSIPFLRSLWLAIQGGIMDTMIPFDINSHSGHRPQSKSGSPKSQTKTNRKKQVKRKHP